MADIKSEDAPRLRELCEQASKEFDNDKLLDLIRQINDLLDIKRRERSDLKKTYSDWFDSLAILYAAPSYWTTTLRHTWCLFSSIAPLARRNHPPYPLRDVAP